MKRISILGSTGSIGTQTLEVCRAQGFEVVALAAHSNVKLLAEQVLEFHPSLVCIFDETKEEELKKLLLNMNIDKATRVVTKMEGLCAVAEIDGCDIVLNAVVGMVGLRPTLAAINAKKTIALANKETLVTGGKLVMEMAKKNGVSILPVDSEHSAIFQSLQGNSMNGIKKILLTASGGPFFGKTKLELLDVTVEQTLKHPNWSMGAKITVDSATMMNKGLELIEACWLFDKKPSEVEIIIHRESVIHSLVEYEDGAVIGQLGVPDMKVPIQYALTYPNRKPCGVKPLSLTDYGTLSFNKPDFEMFDCLNACTKAAQLGGLYPTIVNGANEEAVALFLDKKISFLDIGKLVYGSLSLKYDREDFELMDIEVADLLAREYVKSQVNS